jgi:hypothetical protein
MQIAGFDVNPKLESSRCEQAFQCWEGRLPQVAFVGGDHGGRDTRSVAQLLLGKGGL